MDKRLLGAALAAVVAIGLAASGGAAQAKVFRWANDGDVNSMDPYARNETFLLTFDANMYEPLVGRDRSLKVEPALATEWKQTDPNVWRFKLRQGVKFHDGTPFTADDVIFSYQRVLMPGSNLSGNFATVKEIKKVDDFTVDVVTKSPDPILPEELTSWAILSKAWCEKNNAVKPADITKNEESFATRNENGTGPFILKERQPDVKTVLVPNPNWWGKKEHNLDEVVFSIIKDPLTRVSALLSGEIDMIYNTPPEATDKIKATKGLKLLQKAELRTIYLGLDQSRDELLESSVKGKNPLKDVRVRKAFYEAIDETAIAQKVMRGFAQPTALLIGAGVNGFDESINKRFPVNVADAKKLMAEAGYPTGFEIGMDCPNDRYVNDEQICQAVVAMLARIGVKVNLLAQPRAKFFAKVNEPAYNTSFFLLGWTPQTYDAHNALLSLAATRNREKGTGIFNNGGYADPKVDELVTQIQGELDQAKRNKLIVQALTLVKDDFGYIPLHQQQVVWATRDTVNVVQLPDNYFPLRYVTVK
ncbi:MAG TPA: ABC transporter substrate-binding protein [Stellaceae bacterium]|nr:ABC transporter substrate-binding protein [Stellaceae bacterium]